MHHYFYIIKTRKAFGWDCSSSGIVAGDNAMQALRTLINNMNCQYGDGNYLISKFEKVE